jgi:fumarate reductase iron-sulfur subunit
VTMDAELLARECNADSGYRCLTIEILRCNPAEPRERPRWQCFPLADAPGMTLFIALTQLREEVDPSLQFDFVCSAGICGSCGMLINGRPGLACRTLTRDLPERVRLAPLPWLRDHRGSQREYGEVDARYQ